MHSIRKIAALCAALSLAACGGGSSDPPAAPPPAAGPPPAPVSAGFSAPTAARTISVGGGSVAAAEGQALVVLAEDVTQAQYDAVVERLRALGATAIGARDDLRLLQASVAAGGETALVDGLAGQAGIEHAGYNLVIETTRPNPPYRGWLARPAARMREHAKAIGSAGRWWTSAIGLEAAHQVEADLGIGSGPRIAIVDTGLPAAQNVVAAGRATRVDAFGASLSGDSTADVADHGLKVTAFAAGSSADAAGVSRYASVLMVDVYSDQCTGILRALGCPLGIGRIFQTDLAEGIRTAVNSDARVVNVSWGDVSECKDTEAVRLAARRSFRAIHTAAVNLARRMDKLLVFSAGNNCEKSDDQLLPRAADPAADSWRSHALVTGASTEAGKDALFSRMGQVVNLMAPGEAVSYGQGPVNGTSFAAPIVTGAAALVQGVSPQLSAPETRYLLTSSAEASITYADAAAAAYRGYVGRNASAPALLVNVGNAAQAARLTRDAALKTLDRVPLAKGATRSVSFDVELPATGVRALDVVFVVDVSGSYGDDIATLKTQAGAIVDALLARGIDVQFAVTEFADFPIGRFGSPGDHAFQRLSRMSGDRATVIAGIDALSIKSGNDGPESQLEALFQAATGTGRDINGNGSYEEAAGDVLPQPVGFRTGAAKVVLFATDASFHDSDTETGYPGAGFGAAVAALKERGIKIIALQSGTVGSAAADIERLVGAVGGTSYQLSFSSTEIAAAIAAGIDTTLAEVEVSSEKIAGAEWITSITQDKTVARPGEKVTFTVNLQGQRSESIDALAYDLYVWVRGNGSALLQRVKIPIEVVR